MNGKFNELPGTPLSEKDITGGNVYSIHDQIKAYYAWDTGIAIGRYLEGLYQGKIIGSYCRNCKLTVVPPRIVCEWCFRPMNNYVPLKDTGRINTFSLCYVTWDVQRIQSPEIPAVIEIDGASPMHGIMHKLGEVDPENIHMNMRVQAVWLPPEERQGAITDIRYFKPMEK